MFHQLLVLLELVTAQRRQPQMSYLSVPVVPEPPALLRPLLAAEDLSSPCDEACFVAHVDTVVRSAAVRAWEKVDANDDGQLDLEEMFSGMFRWALTKTNPKKDKQEQKRKEKVHIPEIDLSL